MRIKYLLGATKYNEVAFAEIERYADGRFSASFETVRPFNVDRLDKHDYAESYIECFDKESLYDMCEEYECSPQDLPDCITEEMDIQELIDCSLYPDTIKVDGEDWMFESGSCGQHDLRGEMEVYINKEAFDSLIKLWDEYHLKPIPEDTFKNLGYSLAYADNFNEHDWITEYIKENF